MKKITIIKMVLSKKSVDILIKYKANGTKNVVVGTVGAVGNSIWWAGSGIISIGGNVLGVG